MTRFTGTSIRSVADMLNSVEIPFLFFRSIDSNNRSPKYLGIWINYVIAMDMTGGIATKGKVEGLGRWALTLL